MHLVVISAISLHYWQMPAGHIPVCRFLGGQFLGFSLHRGNFTDGMTFGMEWSTEGQLLHFWSNVFYYLGNDLFCWAGQKNCSQSIDTGLYSHVSSALVKYVQTAIISLLQGAGIFMAALCNRGPLYFCPVVSFFLSIFFFYSSPNLSGHRLDVYHTSTHGVALARI